MIALLTTLLILPSTLDGGPKELHQVIQAALDFNALHEHIAANSIIATDGIKYILADQRLPNDLALSFNGKPLHFNNKRTTQLFFEGVSFAFQEILIKKNKATISYFYYPDWRNCSQDQNVLRSEYLGIFVQIELVRNEDSWMVSEGSMKDLQFKANDPLCIREQYIPIIE